jgi:O-antigen ligase
MTAQYLLIILSASAFFLLARFNRQVALALFIALFPVYLIRFVIPLGPLLLPSTLLEVLFGVLALDWFLRTLRKKSELIGSYNLRPWTMSLLLLLVGSMIGITLSAEPLAALGLWRAYFLEPLLFFIIFVDSCRTTRARKLVLAGLGSTIVVVGIIAIIQKITGWWIPNPVWVPVEVRRVTAFYGFPNGIGLMAAPITVLLTGWSFILVRAAQRRRDFILAGAVGLAALLGVLAILFAVSEGALLGLIFGLLTLGLSIRMLRPFVLSAVIVACVLIMSYGPLRNYASIMLTMRDESWGVRKIVWIESLDMLSDRIVWGAGLAGYQSALTPYHQAKHIEIFKYPHNFFLNFWSEVGLIGLIGWLALIGVFFRLNVKLMCERPNEWLPRALLAAMIALLIHGLVDVPYFKNDLAMLFFVLLGLTESMRRQHLAVDQQATT